MPPFAGEPSHWTHHTAEVAPGVSLHYVDVHPTSPNGKTLVLIHGYPETWYCWRHVMQPLADAGYRIVAVDYRGAGDSSKPRGGFDKWTMAKDVRTLFKEKLGVDKAIVFGYDIGMMVAVAMGMQFPDDLDGLVLFEAPVPGTSFFEVATTDPEFTFFRTWHFFFHNAGDLPELLTQGKEREYIASFHSRLCYDPSFTSRADLDIYAQAFSQPGAMRSGFDVYRAFLQDKEDLLKHLKEKGKTSVPVLATAGSASPFGEYMEGQCREFAHEVTYKSVEHAMHWVPEENPQSFVELVTGWLAEKGLK
ncbi:hypothetical protein JCM10207_000955 [Rhodosporidiobolus poonsookiae]